MPLAIFRQTATLDPRSRSPMRKSWIILLMLALAAVPLPASPPETVVLLHGLGRGPWSMKRLEQVLRADGYIVHNVGYPSQGHGVAALAEATLAPFLGPETSPGRIHFVTHSLGGILIRHYLATRGTPPNLGRVVMLAPPNQGSEIVDRLRDWRIYRWVNGPAGLELGTDSTSVPQTLGPLPGDIEVGVIAGNFSWNPLFSVWIDSPNDGKVSIARSHVEGQRDHAIVRSSHTWIMWRRITLDHIRVFLRQGRFAETGSASNGAASMNPQL